jgi:hypothetical protein
MERPRQMIHVEKGPGRSDHRPVQGFPAQLEVRTNSAGQNRHRTAVSSFAGRRADTGAVTNRSLCEYKAGDRAQARRFRRWWHLRQQAARKVVAATMSSSPQDHRSLRAPPGSLGERLSLLQLGGHPAPKPRSRSEGRSAPAGPISLHDQPRTSIFGTSAFDRRHQMKNAPFSHIVLAGFVPGHSTHRLGQADSVYYNARLSLYGTRRAVAEAVAIRAIASSPSARVRVLKLGGQAPGRSTSRANGGAGIIESHTPSRPR